MDFQESLRRNLILNGFDEINFDEEDIYSFDYTGNIGAEIFRKTKQIGRLSINYDLFESDIFIGNILIYQQRKGYGKKVVSNLEETSREFEFKKIYLLPKDSEAQNFWEHMGYTTDSSGKMIKLL